MYILNPIEISCLFIYFIAIEKVEISRSLTRDITLTIRKQCALERPIYKSPVCGTKMSVMFLVYIFLKEDMKSI